MKKIVSALLAMCLCASLGAAAFAEYIPCLPGEEHEFTPWQPSPEEEGLYVRTCEKCGYQQKASGTDEAHLATTLALDPPQEDAAAPSNPATGACAE